MEVWGKTVFEYGELALFETKHYHEPSKFRPRAGHIVWEKRRFLYLNQTLIRLQCMALIKLQEKILVQIVGVAI
jgi:hypothetical protein